MRISQELQRNFLFLPHQEGRNFPHKGGYDHVFRLGMVLVACDCGGAHRLYPVQGKAYGMVERAEAEQEKGEVWEMGG